MAEEYLHSQEKDNAPNLFSLIESAGIDVNAIMERAAQASASQASVSQPPPAPSVNNLVAYIIAEKKNFRTEAFCEQLNRHINAKILYLYEEAIESINNASCYIIDITPEALTVFYQGKLHQLQDSAVDSAIPVFLIGDPEVLEKIEYIFKDANNKVVSFTRPIDVKDCIKQIRHEIKNNTITTNQKNILVVDDSTTFLKLVKKTLKNRYRVTIAQSAFECIKILSKSEKLPDLIIIDYMMPACNGMTLCQMIRDNEETKDIPILFYSGNNNTEEIIQLMPMIDGYYLKSDPIKNLTNYIDNMFANIEKQKSIKFVLEDPRI